MEERVNPLPNKPWFLRVCVKSLLKNSILGIAVFAEQSIAAARLVSHHRELFLGSGYYFLI